MSRLAGLLAFLLVILNGSELQTSLRYQRVLTTRGAGESCAVLDPEIFAHAAESLRDLRLLDGDGRELPYVLTVSGTANVESVTAPVRNLMQHGSVLSFDLAMPARPYTDVELDLVANDFVATAVVTGRVGTPPVSTELGQFAVFDLAAQHLSRSTVLHLQETALATLHVELRAAQGSSPLRPEMVRGATVPPSREAQTLYTTAVQSRDVEQRGQETVVRLELPARVPIERVLVDLSPNFHESFSRPLRLQARVSDTAGAGASASEVETITGVITHLHLRRDGLLLTSGRMTMPATLGANLQREAAVEVAIENGANVPLPVTAVELQTRERRICFSVPADGARPTLFYGDDRLRSPDYADSRQLVEGGSSQVATMGPEQLNPVYAARTQQRSFRQRHPRLLSALLIAAVLLFGAAALRSTKLRV